MQSPITKKFRRIPVQKLKDKKFDLGRELQATAILPLTYVKGASGTGKCKLSLMQVKN